MDPAHQPEFIVDQPKDPDPEKRTRTLKISVETVRAKFKKMLEDHKARLAQRSGGRRRPLVKNATGISSEFSTEGRVEVNAGPDIAANDRVRLLFNKQSFKDMKIHGQFNLGFIMATYEGDLFIIDQHATDEKHNFELIKRTTKIQSQPMVKALILEMTRAQELTVIDNLPVFERNGFKVEVSSSAEPGRQLQLRGMPTSKGKVFSTDDVYELIALLQEGQSDPSTLLLPKALSLFASKACRRSVMIGTALTKAQMRTHLDNMSGLDQPWNCPHGRPTMRHFYDLKNTEPFDADL